MSYMAPKTIVDLPLELHVMIMKNISDLYSVVAFVSTYRMARCAFTLCAEDTLNNVLDQWPPQIRCIIHATVMARLTGYKTIRNDMKSFCERYIDQVQQIQLKAESLDPCKTLQTLVDLVSETKNLVEMWRLSSLTRLRTLVPTQPLSSAHFPLIDTNSPAEQAPISHIDDEELSATERYRMERAVWRLQLYGELFQWAWVQPKTTGPDFVKGEQHLAMRIFDFEAEEMKNALWFLRFVAEILIQAANGRREKYSERAFWMSLDFSKTRRILSRNFEYAGGMQTSLLWRLGFFRKLHDSKDVFKAYFTTDSTTHNYRYTLSCQLPLIQRTEWPDCHGADVANPIYEDSGELFVNNRRPLWSDMAFFIWDSARLERYGDSLPQSRTMLKAYEKERTEMEMEFRRYFSSRDGPGGKVPKHLPIPKRLEALLGRPYRIPGEAPIWRSEENKPRGSQNISYTDRRPPNQNHRYRISRREWMRNLSRP